MRSQTEDQAVSSVSSFPIILSLHLPHVPCVLRVYTIFFPAALKPPVGQGFLIFQSSRSHLDTPYSVGLLWMSDQPDAEIYLTTQNSKKRQNSMLPAGYEPAIPVSEQPQTHAFRLRGNRHRPTPSYTLKNSLFPTES